MATATATNSMPYRKTRSSLSKKYQHPLAIRTAFDASNLAIAKGAFIGVCCKDGRVYRNLQEALEDGLQLVQWDGM